MKQIWEALITANEEHEESFRPSSALLMILLFLFFWGASFYVLVSSLG